MKKVYFCIDGFSFKRISDFYRYEHKRHSRLNVAAIETYLRYEIERRLEWEGSFEHLIIEKHFYHSGKKSDNTLNFEKNLINAGYIVHYADLNIFANRLAHEAKKFSLFVLLSTQRQCAKILRKVRRNNISSILIGWDAFCTNSTGHCSQWKTDKVLIRSANIYCPLEKMLNQPSDQNPLVEIMFEKFYSTCLLNLQYG
jgi:hypothetical protein